MFLMAFFVIASKLFVRTLIAVFCWLALCRPDQRALVIFHVLSCVPSGCNVPRVGEVRFSSGEKKQQTDFLAPRSAIRFEPRFRDPL